MLRSRNRRGLGKAGILVKPAIGLAACLVVAGVAKLSTSTAAAAEPSAKLDTAAKVDFAKDIQPILNDSCVRCQKMSDARGGAAGGPRRGGQGGAGGGPGGGPPGPRGPAGGLRLDDKDAAMKGGKHGKAIVAGKADDSLMFKVLKGPVKEGKDQISGMPKPKRGEEFHPLEDEKIQLVKQWIDQGADWPASEKTK